MAATDRQCASAGRLIFAIIALLSPLGQPLPAWSAPADVEIVRTRFDIPHIKADSFYGLGYGAAYAYAQDNVCLLADTLLSVKGDRSEFHGAETLSKWSGVRNIASDVFYKTYLDPSKIAALYSGISPEARDLVDGYADGYNHFLSVSGPEGLPAGCRGASWVRPIAAADVLLLVADKMIQGSMMDLIARIADTDPVSGSPAPGESQPHSLPSASSAPGSNAYAIGRELTGGSGVLVANPHFPWDGPNRFYEMHLTIPGRFDVMGATITPFPLIVIGFNKDVAWTHTVSTGKRRIFYELTLAPNDPTTYVFDGKPEKIRKRDVQIYVKTAAGAVESQTHHIYETRFGPVVSDEKLGLAWTASHAYAVRDAMLPDSRAIDQWLHLDQAQNTDDIRSALAQYHGTPWINTIAADRHGDVLYADMSVVPNLDAKQLADCKPSPAAQKAAELSRQIILDGSRASCDWKSDPTSEQDGIIPAAQMPLLERTDYVLNSNDSFWLANAKRPLTGFSPLIGPIGVPQGLRTRMGFRELERLIAAKRDRISAADIETMVMSDRSLAAELTLDDIVDICKSRASNSLPMSACTILKDWDRRDDAESVGAILFRETWARLSATPDLWATPFDPAEPLTTPARLATNSSAVQDAVASSIQGAIEHLADAHIPLDAKLGTVQTRRSSAGAIPLNGGSGEEGVLNVITVSKPLRATADDERVFGSSYMQSVFWDDDGPVANALLAYGQSSEPGSEASTDQTLKFLIKEWPRLPFSPTEIMREKVSEVRLPVPR